MGIKRLSTDIKVEKVGDKFKVVFTMTDEADAEDLLQNLTQIRKSLGDQFAELGQVDTKAEQDKKRLNEEIVMNQKLEAQFKEVEAQLKLQAKLNEEMSKRTPEPTNAEVVAQGLQVKN